MTAVLSTYTHPLVLNSEKCCIPIGYFIPATFLFNSPCKYTINPQYIQVHWGRFERSRTEVLQLAPESHRTVLLQITGRTAFFCVYEKSFPSFIDGLLFVELLFLDSENQIGDCFWCFFATQLQLRKELLLCSIRVEEIYQLAVVV